MISLDLDDAAEAEWQDWFAAERVPRQKGWDESQHPRHPAGSPEGGEFAESGGGGSLAQGLSADALAHLDMMAHAPGEPFTFARLHEGDQREVRNAWLISYRQSLEARGLSREDAQAHALTQWQALPDRDRDTAVAAYVGAGGMLTPGTQVEDILPEHYVVIEPAGPGESEQARVDYQRTANLARYLVRERAVEILRSGPDHNGYIDNKEGSGAARARNAIEDAAQGIWGEWLEDSASSMGSAFQVAVADVLGVTSSRIDAARKRDVAIGGVFSDAENAYVHALYETTQYLLAKAGIDHLDVYRAVFVPQERVKPLLSPEDFYLAARGGKQIPLDLEPNGAASASTMAQVANGWQGLGDTAGQVRVVLRSRAPARSIVSLPVYGKNEHHENEVVVGGTDWRTAEVWYREAPTFEKVPYQGRPPKLTKTIAPPDPPQSSLFISLWDLEPGPGGEWLQQAPPHPDGGGDAMATKALTASTLEDGGALIPDGVAAPADHAMQRRGVVMAVLPRAAALTLDEWRGHWLDGLDPVDLIDVCEIEETLHVTVRYGFLDTVQPEDAAPILAPFAPLQLLIAGLMIFEGAEGGTRDVLVAHVASAEDALVAMNTALAALPHEDTYSQYVPHCTLAYLTVGSGQRLLDAIQDVPHVSMVVDSLYWRGADGLSAALPLPGGTQPLRDQNDGMPDGPEQKGA